MSEREEPVRKAWPAPLDVDERNWLAGEGTIAAALGGERLMARFPLVEAAYKRGRDDGATFGPLPEKPSTEPAR